MEEKTIIDVDTPLMNQYKAIKSKYKDAILFFRLGDFYEMFGEDAKIASKICGLMLTTRQNVLMCGVPYHSSINYISRLINKGFKVAICEQVGEEDKKTRLFKRKVVRVITPGTIIEENLLNSKASNYLCSIVIDIVGWGISWMDVSTGEFYALNKLDDKELTNFFSLISRISPSEFVVDKRSLKYLNEKGINIFGEKLSVYEPDDDIKPLWANEYIWQNNKLALKAAILAFSYIKSVQPEIGEIKPLYYDDNITLKLDENAIKTLELVDVDYEGGHSLFDVLDLSKTPMGSRLIKKWILNPLTDFFLINSRLNAVEYFYNNPDVVLKITEIVEKIADIERSCGRIINHTITPGDLIAIKNSVSYIDRLISILEKENFISVIPEVIRKLKSISKLKALKEVVEKAVDESSSLKVGEGDLFKKGYNREYDELKLLIEDSQSIISQMELKERERTNIPSLKIGYNSNFGYYIEITKTHISRVPHNYIRKQTLVSSERFITPELKELEEKIFGAREKIRKLESYLFSELKKEVFLCLNEIMDFSWAIAHLDAFCALSEVARKNNYVRPEITSEDLLYLENARHPVVEKFLAYGSFVGNDLKMDENTRTIILTGPNMSGKSVYLRQTALIVIMAHMGSFVPCDKAKISIIDRIMTRIGAHDRLVKGESTFMVEMKETSNILKLATKKSLILLDEVGRGTSTFDGISIAYAVCEYIHKNIGAKVLFATHFFEITELANKYPQIKNYNILVKEWVNSKGETEISFLHRVVEGAADRSYGIWVAQIAGLPGECIKRAKEILSELESRTIDIKKNDELLPLFSTHPVVDKIRLIDVNNITPVEALNILNELKKSIN